MVRVKVRYYLCQIVVGPNLVPSSSFNVPERTIAECIKSEIREVHGDYGLGLAQYGLGVNYINPETHMVVIRARRDVQKMVANALIFINRIGDRSAFFNTLHVSGTIRSCYKFLKSHNKKELISLRRMTKDPKERKLIQSHIDTYGEADGKKRRIQLNKGESQSQSEDADSDDSMDK